MVLPQALAADDGNIYFSIDSVLVYWNFFLDFGPSAAQQRRRVRTGP